MPFPNAAIAPTADAFSKKFDSVLRDKMELQIATLAAKYGISGATISARHAAVKYLGTVYLKSTRDADPVNGIIRCKQICIDALKRTMEEQHGKTINAAQFRGGSGSAQKRFRDHEPMLNLMRATFLGAQVRSKSRRNLIFLLVGCEYGDTVKPPPDDSWVEQPMF